MQNNYRVDIFFRAISHYKVEFPEYWLAKTFAEAVKDEDGVEGVYILERISDQSFDITKRIK
jgi:hypothetical protein